MILYNVTVAVEPSIHQDWLNWMNNTHLPEVMATGRFLLCRMFRINPESREELTYSVQYEAENMENYHAYVANEASALKQKTVDRYGDKVLAYRTILQHVATFTPGAI